MIKAPGVLILSLFFIAFGTGAQERPVLNADICDLLQSPEQYAGKMVRVKGQVSSGWTKRGRPIEGFSIKQPFSSLRCIAELTVVLPQKAEPKPDFDVRQDASFRKLQEALHTSMTAAGIFQGRFDLLGVRGDRKPPATASRTGKMQRVAGRLVLEQVSEVDAHVLYNK
jgi:hypothetical protein